MLTPKPTATVVEGSNAYVAVTRKAPASRFANARTVYLKSIYSTSVVRDSKAPP
jgi:hypothetical protein